MVDRNLMNFHGRLGRIEKIHEAGGGFEANGALGMSYYNAHRRPRRRASLIAPLALICMAIVFIKASVFAVIGEEAYGVRLGVLQNGNAAEKAGAYILQADPLTVTIAEKVRPLFY